MARIKGAPFAYRGATKRSHVFPRSLGSIVLPARALIRPRRTYARCLFCRARDDRDVQSSPVRARARIVSREIGRLRTYRARRKPATGEWRETVNRGTQESLLCAVTLEHVCEIARLLLAESAIQCDACTGRRQRDAFYRNRAGPTTPRTPRK